jgi:hypothetical protein
MSEAENMAKIYDREEMAACAAADVNYKPADGDAPSDGVPHPPLLVCSRRRAATAGATKAYDFGRDQRSAPRRDSAALAERSAGALASLFALVRLMSTPTNFMAEIIKGKNP